MIYKRNKIHIPNINNPKVSIVDESWNKKHSSSKWVNLVKSLYKKGYTIYVYNSSPSIYLTILGKQKAIKVRVSNHKVCTTFDKGKLKNLKTQRYKKNGLLVGVDGVSSDQAYYLITETI